MSNEKDTTAAAPVTLSKKDQRIATALQMINEREQEDLNDDPVSDIGYRAHMAAVLHVLGRENALGDIDAGVDKRVACGLEPLDLLKLALAGKLPKALERSADEVFEKSRLNAQEAREQMEKDRLNDRARPSMGGPVKMPRRRQSMS